jgi:addiction module HigA family antidote
MIRSYADEDTRALFEDDASPRRIPPDVRKRAKMRLELLGKARRVEDMRSPPSNRLEALKGDRAGQFRCGSTSNGVSVFGLWTATLLMLRFAIIIEDHAMSIPATKGPANPSHPGEHLAEFLDEYGLSQAAFARIIGVKPMEVSRIITGARPVTAEMAMRLGAAFDQSPELWLGLQQEYDLAQARKKLGDELRSVKPLAA